ncbi:MAG: methyltransferase domain-containing protein [Rhodocyclales bacterium]|nr:methyltransferase domain-containing protein [Rhodocyclales bacterium]
MVSRIESCRLCGNSNLVPIIDLGEQYLTGVFPPTRDESLTRGPLRLVKCHGNEKVCGLLQLEHSFDLNEMYGANYGYRSGLNASMVRHLHGKVARIRERVDLTEGDLVVDIGSNDGTTLGAYPDNLLLVGIDPTSSKFRQYYAPHVRLIPSFFSAAALAAEFPGIRAKVVTSFSMFYDLEAPLDFAREIASILDPQGIWVFEQSYMPLMLERTAYDTICHEHLEYYGLHQIAWILERAGLRLIDVELNDVNGGSFSVVAAQGDSSLPANDEHIAQILADEASRGLIDSLEPYRAFSARVDLNRQVLQEFLAMRRLHGERVFGLGASTKGNVMLQSCGLGPGHIVAIGEINPDKFGSVTPGSWIPIINEKEVLAADPDYLLIMPWHFREFMLRNPAYAGRRLVFPLPTLEIVNLP